MPKSFREYIPAVLKVWWAMLVFIISDGLGIYGLATAQSFYIPAWLLIVIGTGALIVAQFLAFHKVRVERDKCTEGVDLSVEELGYLRDHRTELELGVDNNGMIEPIVSSLMAKDMIQVKYRRTSLGPRQYDQRYLSLTDKAKKILIWADVMNKKEVHN